MSKGRFMNYNLAPSLLYALLCMTSSCGNATNSHLNETLPILKSGPHGMKFSHIAGGTFQMGSPEGETGRDASVGYPETQHWVKLTNDYWMLTTEVTRGQWHSVTGKEPREDVFCHGRHRHYIVKEFDYPVLCVNTDDIEKFLIDLNQQQENDGYRYRLPTEAEWEFAARGLTETAYSVKGQVESFTWHGGPNNRPHPVAKLRPNKYGLYDVHGNAQEWTSDWAHQYKKADSIDQAIENPKGGAPGTIRMIRSGSWAHPKSFTRSAARLGRPSNQRTITYGFRLVRTTYE